MNFEHLVTFRAVGVEDKPTLLRWRNSPHVARYMYNSDPISAAEHERWFDSATNDDSRRLWIIESDGRGLGLVNLYDINPRHRRCTWGFYIGEQDAQNRGLGGFIEFKLLEYAFGNLDLHKVNAEVLTTNVATINLHEHFGFVREGVARDHIFRGDHFVDVVTLGILRGEWSDRRDAMRSTLERMADFLSRPPQ